METIKPKRKYTKRAPSSQVGKMTPMQKKIAAFEAKNIELQNELNEARTALSNYKISEKDWPFVDHMINNLKKDIANLKHQEIGYLAVISYLENKSENNPV